MINKLSLFVDAGYAFDYLSILQVKVRRLGNPLSLDNFHACKDSLSIQIGEELITKILNSEEYKNLVEINNMIFDSVEKARKNEVSAKHVDSLNTERFKAKKILHQKFFKTEIKEEKNG